ncbi:hypothetical protein RclHR1_06100003 [Rhizophagus clarus]|uniref:Protein kinase domain-containing protein n=1 Tax=Rhizophagus clarus TaxID=94130 RepID=A0A2Z6RWF1_9GLOM|nr:hypothetical protein RclHR1_06100003 [Rhizophagus clarus]
MVIMDYANKGSLRRNLTKIIKSNWKQRLYMLYKIISGLNEIHSQNLIHCDIHSGNILCHNNKNDNEKEDNNEEEEYDDDNEKENNEEKEENNNEEKEDEEEEYNYEYDDDEEEINYEKEENDKIYISDLGLCKPSKSSKKVIYGVIPFMAPEVLRGKPPDSAYDIYSFSMIMWEFTSGATPFNNKAHDFQLALSICEGERPKIVENTPQCYVDLMKKCWNEDPSKRPSAKEVKNIIENWIFRPYKNKINEELKSNIMEFINAPIEYNNDIIESHQQVYYTSRSHDFTSDDLNESLRSKYMGQVDDMESLVVIF